MRQSPKNQILTGLDKASTVEDLCGSIISDEREQGRCGSEDAEYGGNHKIISRCSLEGSASQSEYNS